MKKKEIAKDYIKKINQVKKYNKAYFENDNSLISDADYDILKKKILELEKKSTRHSNVCIQHLLPHMMDYNGRFKKNIALYETETDSFKNSRWSCCNIESN